MELKKTQHNSKKNTIKKKTPEEFATSCVPIDRKAVTRIKGITCQDAAECSLHINGLQSRGLHKQKLVFF